MENNERNQYYQQEESGDLKILFEEQRLRVKRNDSRWFCR